MVDEMKPACNLEENKRKMFIVINQMLQLEALLFNVQAAFDARSLTASYNALLAISRDVFHCDDLFLGTIEHLKPIQAERLGDPIGQRDAHMAVIGQVLVDMAILKGAVLSFIQVYLSNSERDELGFGFGPMSKKS